MVTPTENQFLLMFVIVQDQDVPQAKSGLEKIDLTPWVFPSTGGFLRKRNSTLLIACSVLQIPEVTRVFQQNCRQRIEYHSMSLDSSSIGAPLAFPMPVSVGGAVIFSFEVEHQEEFV